MLATDRAARRKPAIGTPSPRIAPPVPARTDVEAYKATAKAIGIDLIPWQVTAGKYLEAGAPAKHLWREVCIVVARQNGKTTLLRPLIVKRLLAGRRIMHTGQNRALPREVFEAVVEDMQTHYPDRVKGRPRFANGQEEIRTQNGGRYRIVAPTRGGARGASNDDVLVDEVREMTDYDFIAAAKPTLTASADPQIIYLSNAGSNASVVLNDIRMRRESDPSLAYLEWSAEADCDPSDVVGWQHSNPSLGHLPGVRETLEREYLAASLTGRVAVFETEHLCRWVVSMDDRLLSIDEWRAQDFGDLPAMTRPVMGVSMDITGNRASAVIAWQAKDASICLDVHDTRDSPIDVNTLGPALEKLARANRVTTIAYDPYTDADLIRHFRKPMAVNGRLYASASAKFVRLVRERKLRINDPQGLIASDLAWTTKRSGPFDSYMAVLADGNQTNTAVLAAIRAAWLASDPEKASGPVRIF